MQPLSFALMTCAMLMCGGVAVVVMMNRLGRPESPPTPGQILLHRVAGWGFTGFCLIIFIAMFKRFYAYWEEDPARIVLHYTTAFALLLLLVLKVGIPRFYPGFRKHLFPLGIAVFLLAFLTAASSLSHYLVRITQQVPYISHASISSSPNLELGKQLMIERCRTCHVLDKILKPRTAAAWESVVAEMAKLAWPRIRPDEATQILYYLTETRTPRPPTTNTGDSLLDGHCLPCHQPTEIFAVKRTPGEWEKIVLRMSKEAPEIVPAVKRKQLVDALTGIQSRYASKGETEQRPK